ncbi:F0F1 ATP synthase subunit gamma [Planobispora siamensis]|uniref:ATP synthase gamma chain n=1 Tax=Planobispora siamensis TaxID=936338 RepID=A0A8J3SR42_9ACTN|nr:F0F1 ATP synthase subunit gamma [Planobispora siamensis]GIH97965.1 ATP synthase gamma chain [Planobispora siamensis]
MAGQLRAIRQKIKSVRSIAKITRAQELIATSRVSKARDRAHDAEPYAREITRAASTLLTHHPHADHALLNRRPDTSRVAVLLVTSDRGFCGGYNHNVLRQGEALAALLRRQGKEPVFYVTGRKGIEWYRFRGRPTVREWQGFSGAPAYDVAAEIGRTLVEAYDMPTAEGGVGEVHVVFTEFVSMLTQRTVVRRLLPIEVEEREAPQGHEPSVPAPFTFEPSAGAVLDVLLNKYVDARIWHILLISAAAEHAARRTAMTAATDNARQLIGALTRQANEARQAEITTELTEIVGGAAALAASNRD